MFLTWGHAVSIIAVLNPKGGCGKTTISTHLAMGLYQLGFRVLLVDSDPQGSARDWHGIDPDNPVALVALDRPNNFKSLPTLAQDYDFVVVDGAAKLESIIAAVIKVADLVIIPVQPSPFDLWATQDLVELIETRQTLTDGKPDARFLVNRMARHTVLSREIDQALDELAVPALSVQIQQRQAYPRSGADGKTVLNATIKHPQAIFEIRQLLAELLPLFGVSDHVTGQTA